jgi:GNAT superfamily N-acetyltransferase
MAAAVEWRIREATIEEGFEVAVRVPDLTARLDLAEFRRRLGVPSALVLLGETGAGRAAGFKAGYDRFGDGSWYSWLGGVVPECRGGGLAQALLDRQEAWARARGYRSLYVKTRNRFLGMRALLTRAGYQTVGVDAPGADTPIADLRLIFVKAL